MQTDKLCSTSLKLVIVDCVAAVTSPVLGGFQTDGMHIIQSTTEFCLLTVLTTHGSQFNINICFNLFKCVVVISRRGHSQALV